MISSPDFPPTTNSFPFPFPFLRLSSSLTLSLSLPFLFLLLLPLLFVISSVECVSEQRVLLRSFTSHTTFLLIPSPTARLLWTGVDYWLKAEFKLFQLHYLGEIAFVHC